MKNVSLAILFKLNCRTHLYAKDNAGRHTLRIPILFLRKNRNITSIDFIHDTSLEGLPKR